MYHYTSIDAFLSIVESKTLRATSLDYLNDESEGELGIALIREVAAEQRKTADATAGAFLETLLFWIDNKYLRGNGSVYVLCFSERPDQLSQWRGYTPHGRGICLGIDIGILVRRMQQLGTGWTFQNCRYNRDSQFGWATAIVNRMRRQAPSAPSDPNDFDLVIARNMSDIIGVAALMKDEAFADEREVRFISPMIPHHDPRVKFRASKSTIIPYIDFPLVEGPDESIEQMELWIGPGPAQRLTHAAGARVMARHQLAKGVGYYPSKIPYREL